MDDNNSLKDLDNIVIRRAKKTPEFVLINMDEYFSKLDSIISDKLMTK